MNEWLWQGVTIVVVSGREVTIRCITTDRYGRTVAELFVNGTNVQQAMVASGKA